MKNGRLPKRATPGRWDKKHDGMTMEQLIDLRKRVEAEGEITPDQANSIFLIKKSHEKKLDDIGFAITQLLKHSKIL